MIKFLLKNRNGQFLLIGSFMAMVGFVLMLLNHDYSRFAFYGSIFFLGFFAAKNAVVDTIQSKSPNVDLLMILAALGATFINYESEGATLLLIFACAEVLEDYASNKSTRAITELMAQVPTVAQVLKDNGDVIEVPTDALAIGDIVIVAKGAQIPIDGTIDRTALINEAALTGESIPVEKSKGDNAFAGTINEGHVFYLTVTKLSHETVFSNIIRMVEEAQKRPSKVSKFIDRIESKYVIAVLITVPIFILMLYTLNDLTFQEAFYRGMVLLTVASPCALVASATPATLSAISNGAKNGVLFKGGAAMEALSSMDVLYSDKTGTLTLGKFKVIDYEIDESILKEVVYMEQQSSHPIADAITTSFKDLDLGAVDDRTPIEEIAGAGVKKGDIIVAKPTALKNFEDPYNYREKVAAENTAVLVGKANQIVGYFLLADQIRSESAEAVAGFQAEDIKVNLITGDHELVAKKVASEIKVDHYYSNCSPEEKIKFIQADQDNHHVVGMIGDGINDAPALAQADIGIAMGSGSSVAMESSDVVIVKNNLAKLLYSFKLSQRLNKIIVQNVIFSIAVIVSLIGLNIVGWLGLPLGVVFHEGSTILVILNGLRLLRQKD
ncbi:heavy metal translocating P-type ATPase [Amphibacillus xylanus]|uniref:Cation-transporting ATPase n=1 Tax=Amphibacillus xylanus (strain ATCC 51415 / DSM 6626 / JCM 7361 / LMG 17667 / NBRC 15112 / Ep01) TaxID=698758 RepID=K0J0C8_AMPXN|nr:heavy metal translocating P-type ATPase [Amphibacillus xylanus]BAM48269.1 cation-transporting ATPase [Amphibacillus xylanus NBRC 15112]